ncbi:MAG: amino acid permease [Myxococcota bacterium]
MTGSDLARVGAFTAACLLVSNAVGSGIFTTTGFLARDLGSEAWILGLWLLGGVLALAGALSYAELGAALPRVGGEYVYLRRAFGPLAGFLSGWTSFALGFGGAIAASAAAFAAYLQRLAPTLAEWDAAWIGVVLVWSITAVHLLGVEASGRFQRAVTVLKIAPILVGVGLAFVVGGDTAETPGLATAEPRFGAAAVGLVFVLYSFSGWNAASYIAGEMRDPARSLPLALVGGTVFVTALYLAVNVVYFAALPVSALGADPVLPVAEKSARALFGGDAARVVVAVLCVSIAGSVSSMVWAGPRVTLAMAEDGALPASLGGTTSGGAPLVATLLQSVWVTLLLFTGTFEQIVVYAGVALAIFGALAVACVPALRRGEPALERPFRTPGYPWVPIAFVAASLWTASYAAVERPVEALLSLGTVSLGIPLFFWARRRAAAPDA